MNKLRRTSLTNSNMKLKTAKFYLRSTSSVSLNERFSQILVDQLTQPRMVTFTPLLSGRSTVVNWNNEASAVSLQQQCQRRRSVWTRLGWRRKCLCFSASRQRGFWSFMKKYNWRVRSISTHRRQPQRRFSRGRDTTLKQHRIKINNVPTKKQLDAQLDKYMSKSKSRLDAQLDEYMSKSKSRLDAQLDEYMAMAGQTTLWD